MKLLTKEEVEKLRQQFVEEHENEYDFRAWGEGWEEFRKYLISVQNGEVEIVNDNVKNPKHYQIIDDIEAIDIIASSMTLEQFKGFCLGSILGYRLRAGKKGDAHEDIAKAIEFENLFVQKKHLCRDFYND